MRSDNSDLLHLEADARQALRWREMLDHEIDEVSATIENIEKRALAEHRAGAVDRARRLDADGMQLRETLRELHRMRRNLRDRFA